MKDSLIAITNNKVYQSHNYTLFLLSTEQKKFAIFTEAHVGFFLQTQMPNKKELRPKTHTMLETILNEFEIKPLQLLIHDIKDTTYFARLFLEQTNNGQKNILEIDVRPSDGLTIALTKNLPIYCTNELLEKTADIA